MKIVHEQEERPRLGADADAARKRAAVETYARNEAALRRTARRYSLCADDAEDALQRGLEILLRKAPTDDPRELVKWTQTVIKHEALAVRRERERILAGPAANSDPEAPDWVALIPADGDGPLEQSERREAVARSREALQALKPQELRALTLLAEGYSYAEIGELTGYSQTKINRCLAEGRERFRKLIARGEDGSRCTEMQPLISAFCDGEAGKEEVARLREHLRACAHCRSTLRAYRAAPGAAAALAPLLPLHRSLFERAHDAVGNLFGRFGGGAAGDTTASAVGAGSGAGGAGIAAVAKIAAVCIGTAGGAAVCATAIVPAPFELSHEPVRSAHQERRETAAAPAETPTPAEVEYEPAAPGPVATDATPPESEPRDEQIAEAAEPVAVESEPAVVSEPVGYAPVPAPAPSTSASNAGSPAGEFGP